MQRYIPPNLQYLILTVLALFLSACASSTPLSTAMPVFAQPSSNTTPRATLTIHPSVTLTPELSSTGAETIKSTVTMAVTSEPIASTLLTNDPCTPIEIDQYLDVVLPLADAHTIDSYEAQKMEGLTDESQIVALRDRAIIRLMSIQDILAPPCLMVAHENMVGSFELLISTWGLIRSKDYTAATKTLQKCYEALAEAVAIIGVIQQE